MDKGSKKHILLVTYYWPPAGGSGVQRWLFFVKYLASMGHKIDVLTVLEPTATPKDETLLNHIPDGVGVHHMSFWEPGRGLYHYANGKTLKPTVFSRFIRWVRANLFFPDARCFWIGKGKKWIDRFIKTHQPDWLITTGPPHSVHLMGYANRNHPHTRWMADFRDPWSEFFVNQELPMTAWMRKRHKKWEQKIVKSAHLVLTTTPALKKRYLCWNSKTEVVYNGFEKLLEGKPSDDFTLTYAGSLKANQQAEVFWTALEELTYATPDFSKDTKVHVYGQAAPFVQQKTSEILDRNLVEWHGYHSKSVVDHALASSHILLFFGNDHQGSDRVINAKIFEYMATGRTVLALVHSHGDLSAFVQKHNLGAVFLYSEKEKIVNWLKEKYASYKAGDSAKTTHTDLSYSRENQSVQLSALLTQDI